eukprot:Hpha_TRINITY_DN13768_c0_g2::TRINITY_DN13768_c0_g2_i1::g.142416::m.142416
MASAIPPDAGAVVRLNSSHDSSRSRRRLRGTDGSERSQGGLGDLAARQRRARGGGDDRAGDGRGDRTDRTVDRANDRGDRGGGHARDASATRNVPPALAAAVLTPQTASEKMSPVSGLALDQFPRAVGLDQLPSGTDIGQLDNLNAASIGTSEKIKQMSLLEAAEYARKRGRAERARGVSLNRIMEEDLEETDRGNGSEGLTEAAGSGLKWKKIELIGSGSFGRVYKGALTEMTDVFIAVKEIFITGPKVISELSKEVGVLRRVDHPNIVRYLGCDRVKSSFFILMDFVAGGSIAYILKHKGPLDPVTVAYFTAQICDGVGYLHRRRIVHRDLKGANILLSDSMVKLADFGSAKDVLQSNDGTGTISLGGCKTMRGTPFWMAPEVITETGHGAPADVWSIGCTVIEMLEAKPPWHGLTPMQAMHRIAKGQLPTLPASYTPDMQAFIKACLQKDAKQRLKVRDLRDLAWVCEYIPIDPDQYSANSNLDLLLARLAIEKTNRDANGSDKTDGSSEKESRKRLQERQTEKKAETEQSRDRPEGHRERGESEHREKSEGGHRERSEGGHREPKERREERREESDRRRDRGDRDRDRERRRRRDEGDDERAETERSRGRRGDEGRDRREGDDRRERRDRERRRRDEEHRDRRRRDEGDQSSPRVAHEDRPAFTERSRPDRQDTSAFTERSRPDRQDTSAFTERSR